MTMKKNTTPPITIFDVYRYDWSSEYFFRFAYCVYIVGNVHFLQGILYH